MTINEYQEKAHSFSRYEDELYPVLGLAEEAGEVAGKVAKYLRKTGRLNWDCDAALSAAVKKELGDVCWMVAEVATVYGFKLEDVMRENIDKLTDRQTRGVIVGEGDNR
jgi:NTP pyrophosphatase (non-canonical NTP hydrolase)